jgi:hypothetical protein
MRTITKYELMQISGGSNDEAEINGILLGAAHGGIATVSTVFALACGYSFTKSLFGGLLVVPGLALLGSMLGVAVFCRYTGKCQDLNEAPSQA